MRKRMAIDELEVYSRFKVILLLYFTAFFTYADTEFCFPGRHLLCPTTHLDYILEKTESSSEDSDSIYFVTLASLTQELRYEKEHPGFENVSLLGFNHIEVTGDCEARFISKNQTETHLDDGLELSLDCNKECRLLLKEPSVNFLSADLNFDGEVNEQDKNILKPFIKPNNPIDCENMCCPDVDGDGRVDENDFSLVESCQESPSEHCFATRSLPECELNVYFTCYKQDSDSSPDSCKSGNGTCNKCSDGSACKRCEMVSLETQKQNIDAFTFVSNGFIRKARNTALRLSRKSNLAKLSALIIKRLNGLQKTINSVYVRTASRLPRNLIICNEKEHSCKNIRTSEFFEEFLRQASNIESTATEIVKSFPKAFRNQFKKHLANLSKLQRVAQESIRSLPEFSHICD